MHVYLKNAHEHIEVRGCLDNTLSHQVKVKIHAVSHCDDK